MRLDSFFESFHSSVMIQLLKIAGRYIFDLDALLLRRNGPVFGPASTNTAAHLLEQNLYAK